MGCIYSDREGQCSVWDENIEQNGSDYEGRCICEDDPDPSDLCEDYQSDD